jgi:hypothetical protein
VIRKEAWPFYRTIFGVRLWWGLEEPEGPKGFRVGVSGFQLRVWDLEFAPPLPHKHRPGVEESGEITHSGPCDGVPLRKRLRS